jgi:hypothetical protein
MNYDLMAYKDTKQPSFIPNAFEASISALGPGIPDPVADQLRSRNHGRSNRNGKPPLADPGPRDNW